MASIVAILSAVRKSYKKKMNGEDTDMADACVDKFDANRDGQLGLGEVKANLGKVGLHADRMCDILKLEQGLSDVAFKLPNFCICVLCFLLALIEFSPPGNTYKVHKHIAHEYGLDGVAGVSNFKGIYDFMADFEHANEELQATSFKYWCEERYADHHWDEHLMVPVWRCPSPRFYALKLISDEDAKWDESRHGPNAASASGHGRRLAGGHSSTSSITNPVPSCEDKDEILAAEVAHENLTCAAAAHDPTHMVCEYDLGIIYCPRTCGFCGPMKYQHTKKFAKPQVTMLPVMIYQSRFAASECHGFAHIYEMQPHNPVLSLLPALDGERNGRVLTCIDRKKHQEEKYAFYLDCPPGSPSTHCVDGKTHITERHTFHGDVIYPMLLIEPERDLKLMKEMEWIDMQTEMVALSTMIYTEDMEIFTSLTVEFAFDEAGSTVGTYKMISYRDMIKSSKTSFIAYLITCSTGALIGVILSLYFLVKNSAECKWGYAVYELVSRTMLCLYPLILLVEWTRQIPMSQEFDHLLHTFLDLESMAHSAVEKCIQKYFDAKTHIYFETSWLKTHCVVAYFVCYVQFLQLIFYFNVHPRMAILTSTLAKAASNIFHFFLLFGVLYIMLAFMAHWMLGPYISQFGTLSDTVKNQCRMMFGEFLQADGVDSLHGWTMAVYWIYAVTFMLIVIWTLLNFFLAIIVDAFVEVKGENEQNMVARGFLTDFFGVYKTMAISTKNRWPARKELMEFFEKSQVVCAANKELSECDPKLDAKGNPERVICTVDDFQTSFPALSQDQIAQIIHHYMQKSRIVLAIRNPSCEC